jgi:hypothetical protein
VMRFFSQVSIALAVCGSLWLAPGEAVAQRCEIPREARGVWRCERGFVIGPENVIIRLPIAETDPEALYNAGVEAAQREDWRVAIAYFTAAHQRAHLVPRYMYNLGLAHARAGNKAAAIAWLVTYLIAEPEAPNRASIWQQIATLEAAAQEDVERIYAGAGSAVELLPATLIESGFPQGVRSRTYSLMAYGAARARDIVRADQLRTLSERSALTPASMEYHELTDAAINGALEDNDLAYLADAEQRGSLPGYRQRYRPGGIEERLRRGLINQDLCRSAFLPSTNDYQRSLCPEPLFQSGVDPEDVPIYRAAQSGSRERLRASLAGMSEHFRWGRAALAVNGQGQEAIRFIDRTRGERLMGSARIGEAWRVADVLLRTGPASEAEPFVRALERYAREDRGSGWSAAVARAMSRAEQGDTRRAIEGAEIFLSRKLVAGADVFVLSEAHTPAAQWSAQRYDARVMVAEFLIDRGRHEQALEVMQALDSLRQGRVALYGRVRASDPAYAVFEAAVLGRATNGTPAPATDRMRLTEDAIIVATTLPGIAHDASWWFEATGRGIVFASQDPSIRAQYLATGAQGLQRGLLRVRAMWSRTGGTWGQ